MTGDGAANHRSARTFVPETSGLRDPGHTEFAITDHAILAAALDPIITIDIEGVIQSASDSVQRVFGWAPAELVGRNVSVLMPEPHRSAHDGYLTTYRRTGKTNILGRTRQFEAVRKDGERFPIDLSVSRVESAAGGLPLFIGIIRDISERIRLERELRLMKDLALCMSTASTLSDALTQSLRQLVLATGWDYGEFWIVDSEGTLSPSVCWTQPDERLNAFAAANRDRRFAPGQGLPGRAWQRGQPIWISDLGAVSDTDFSRQNAARAAGLHAAAAAPVLAGDETVAVLLFLLRQTRREDLHLLELLRTAVAPLGSLIQRKRAEDELERYRESLEQMVEQRTQALAESQQRLQLADRLASIGTLAAGLGHDMHNVLLPVRAHLNALRAAGTAGKLPPEAQAHVDAVRKSAGYLQQLADGLHFLAMDPDGGESGGEQVDLASWWSQAGALLAKAVPRHVRVTANIPPDLPEVGVGAAGLTQAVLNLVVNAGEAIPADRKRVQGRVRITAEREPGGALVRLDVADNGSGMTEEVQRRAVEMFFTSKPRGLGTGLGLALVRKVMDQAGGRIEIQSSIGKGTTVSLLLPLIQAPGGAAGERTAVITLTDSRTASLLRQMLEASGARAQAAASPGAAEIWIAEPTASLLTAGRTWRQRTPDGRLVLLGAPAADWFELQPVIIRSPQSLADLREALSAALAEQAPATTGGMT